MGLGNTVFRNKIKIWFLHSTLVIIAVWILFMPSFVKFEKGSDNIFSIILNDVPVGTAGSEEEAYEAYRNARRAVASDDGELVLARGDLSIEGQNVLWGEVDSVSVMARAMTKVLLDSQRSTLNRAYSIKINEYSVNLSSISDVMELLSTALSKFD